MTSNPSEITPPRVPFLDASGFIDRRWYLWLLSIFRATTNNQDAADLIPSPDAAGAVYAAMIDALEGAALTAPVQAIVAEDDLALPTVVYSPLEDQITPSQVCCPQDEAPLPSGLGYVLPVGEGGTGVSTTPGAGELLIGNGLGFTLAGLTAGTGITITPAAGAVTIASSSSASVSSVDVSGGTTGLTFSGGPITSSGTITMAGTLGVANGGTNITFYATGDLIYASGATTLAKLADVATGNALISGGVGVAPLWGKIGLSTHVGGTLPIANGGTGATVAATALSNLGAAPLAGAAFTGTISAPRIDVDANFYMTLNSGNPLIALEANSYIAFDRTNNVLQAVVESNVAWAADEFQNLLLAGATAATSAQKTLHIPNGTAPSANPASGGVLYAESGALKYRGSGGTVTTLAPA